MESGVFRYGIRTTLARITECPGKDSGVRNTPVWSTEYSGKENSNRARRAPPCASPLAFSSLFLGVHWVFLGVRQ